MGRPEPCHRTETESHAGDGADVVDHDLPTTHARNIGAPRGLDGLHRAAATRAFHETDQGQAHLVGHLLAHEVLALDGRVGGAPAHREVVAAHHDRPTVHLGPPEDEVGGREARELIGLVVGGHARDLAQLVE